MSQRIIQDVLSDAGASTPVQRAVSMSIARTPTSWDLTDPHLCGVEVVTG